MPEPKCRSHQFFIFHRFHSIVPKWPKRKRTVRKPPPKVLFHAYESLCEQFATTVQLRHAFRIVDAQYEGILKELEEVERRLGGIPQTNSVVHENLAPPASTSSNVASEQEEEPIVFVPPPPPPVPPAGEMKTFKHLFKLFETRLGRPYYATTELELHELTERHYRQQPQAGRGPPALKEVWISVQRKPEGVQAEFVFKSSISTVNCVRVDACIYNAIVAKQTWTDTIVRKNSKLQLEGKLVYNCVQLPAFGPRIILFTFSTCFDMSYSNPSVPFAMRVQDGVHEIAKCGGYEHKTGKK
ncbi:hypothetical protein M3Y99_01320700 [Aphelenchoides fujianensis]|nr:hypothetical protein M3Y99_01320700 [Aphelenchoides fujianensis]